jgi:glycosyltransferase involved in cell wall biosynthesis
MGLIVDLGNSSSWLEQEARWPGWLDLDWLQDNNARLLCQLDKGDHLLLLRNMLPDVSRLIAYPADPILDKVFSLQQNADIRQAFFLSLEAEGVLEVVPGQTEAGEIRPCCAPQPSPGSEGRSSLALVSALSHGQAASASESLQSLPDLERHYDITLVVAEPDGLTGEACQKYPVMSHQQFLKTGAKFDRVLYHFENSPYHYDYFALLQVHPGVVVLHEVFLGDCLFSNYGEMSDIELMQAVYISHGWSAVSGSQGEAEDVISAYPVCGAVLQNSYGVILPTERALQELTQFFPQDVTSSQCPIALVGDAASGEEAFKISEVADSVEFIEHAYKNNPARHANALYKNSLAPLCDELPPQDLWLASNAIDELVSCSNSAVRQLSGSQLLVDISAVVRHDLQTGIQRTVRNLLKELLHGGYGHYRVEPIYYDFETECFRYARDFSADFFGVRPLYLADDPVEAGPGDVYLNPDLFYVVTGAEKPRQFLQQWRGRGVQIYNVVYDLLPLLLPHCFPLEQVPLFDQWIRGVTDVSDGVICISRAVASEYQTWVREQNLQLPPVGYFHLGADLEVHAEQHVLTDEDQQLLESIKAPYLLMVGTVEPRKGHLLALDAFELLWSRGVEISLVVVGAQGWIDERAKKRIEALQANEPHFHYLRFVNDGVLDALYKGSASALMASEGEGFGLPLIEAAFRGAPLLLSNLPVFREICGDRARYFTARDPAGMADQVEEWLGEFHRGELPSSAGIQWNSWKDSTDQMMRCITEQHWLVPGDRSN